MFLEHSSIAKESGSSTHSCALRRMAAGASTASPDEPSRACSSFVPQKPRSASGGTKRPCRT
eukprot:2497166-Pleurochrysis_carterae.AAC.1